MAGIKLMWKWPNWVGIQLGDAVVSYLTTLQVLTRRPEPNCRPNSSLWIGSKLLLRSCGNERSWTRSPSLLQASTQHSTAEMTILSDVPGTTATTKVMRNSVTLREKKVPPRSRIILIQTWNLPLTTTDRLHARLYNWRIPFDTSGL